MEYIRIAPLDMLRNGWQFRRENGQGMWHKRGVGIHTETTYDLTMRLDENLTFIKFCGLDKLPHTLEKIHG